MSQFDELIWNDYSNNPIIEPPKPDFILADPTVLDSTESPDKKWHLFAHGIAGIYHYISKDGLKWDKEKGVVSKLSVRPFIFKESGEYFLLYEKITTPQNFPNYDSIIQVKKSKNLIDWSEGETIFIPQLLWHKSTNKIGNVGNPCLVKIGDKYRLYYSAGLTLVPDCHFSEPRFVGIAESKNILGPYLTTKKPLSFQYSNDLETINSRVAAIRVYKTNNTFTGLLTVFYQQDGKSHSSIVISKSRDGKTWALDNLNGINPDQAWKKAFVYVGDLKRDNKGSSRIYYNARNGWTLGQEQIGLAIGKFR